MKCCWNFFLACGQATIAEGNAIKSLGHFSHHAQANQGPPILAEEGDTAEVLRFKPSTHPLHVIVIGVVTSLNWFVGATKPHLVRDHHTKARTDQNGNHLAIQKRPSGFAVHQQNHGAIAWAFIDVRNAKTADQRVVRLIGKFRQVLKTFFGCAKKVLDDGKLTHEDL